MADRRSQRKKIKPTKKTEDEIEATSRELIEGAFVVKKEPTDEEPAAEDTQSVSF